MSTIDSKLVLLTCGQDEQARRLRDNGSRRDARLAALPSVSLPTTPGKTDVDPVLADHEPRRLVVLGTDADLAAVLLRLLRSDRLDVELAHLPTTRSDVAALWGMPRGAAAVTLALEGTARPTPLVRDDAGGVLAGRGEIRGLQGECYCDDALVLRGAAPHLVVAAVASGIAVRAGRTGRLPDGTVAPVPPHAPHGRGAAVGRAVQVGGELKAVLADGVAHPRGLQRRTWYRHTSDWLLARP
ncbi:hypothetical protein [Pseudonocardia sp. GCM10023141]|uniref:hypothetical protein n=1 Tax=Pseudonocardia sp. GCM10023141 TaxID=3252653 RepID=UPI0036137BE7